MNNFELMKKRLETQGGIEQENRMIKDKFRAFKKALLYSYQACTVRMVQPSSSCLLLDDEEEKHREHRALINPDKVKQDYDDKILSIPYFYTDCEGEKPTLRPGDVFEWCKTDTRWIVYLEEITEDAYFRGEIRRCKYKIKFKDGEGNIRYTWAAIRGPVETKIDSIQKNQERIDRPNMTLNILMPCNDITLSAFDRYSEFLFAGRAWKVQAVDAISMKGVLEVNAQEDYINMVTDDVDEEIKNGLVIETHDPTPDTTIIGPTFIYPKMETEFSTEQDVHGYWTIKEKDSPACIISSARTSCKVIWNKMTSGQFTLVWQKDEQISEKVVVVQSLY